MDFRFANLKLCLSLAGAMAVSFAQAQTLMSPGQPIIFSAPDDGNTPADAPVPAAQQPMAPVFDDMVHAPEINFKNPPATTPRLSAPRAVISTPQDQRANWWMQTPAEILGVATPDDVLKIPERDAAGNRKNPTAVEKFFDRQDRMQTNGGGLFTESSPLREGFLDEDGARLNTGGFNPADGSFRNAAQLADPFRQPAPGDAAAAENNDSGWSKTFISPQAPAQSPAQIADMEEFRKLLDPDQPSKPSSPPPGGGFFSSHQNSPGAVSSHPANQNGAAFGDFNNGVSGLPGVAGQAVVPTVTAVPDWKPQPPPWLLKGPQPGVIPKRVVF